VLNFRRELHKTVNAEASLDPGDLVHNLFKYVFAEQFVFLVLEIFVRESNSPPHDVNGQNAALMAGKEIIDKVANDGVRFVSKFRDHPANQSAAAPVPFQINRAVRGFAMDLRPAVWTPRALVFSRNQTESPESRIGHDLFTQRSPPARYDLDHGLHSKPSFSRKSVLLQCFFRCDAGNRACEFFGPRQDCLRQRSSDRYMT
jgi:hypothetical protein